MPEGPSIVILTELAREFEGRTIAQADGNSKAVPFDELPGQPVLSLRSWGKHFLIELPLFSLRVHFLLFGSYRINERKPDAAPRLSLQFEEGGELNFYSCAIKLVQGELRHAYDWRSDVMSDEWRPRLALKKTARRARAFCVRRLARSKYFFRSWQYYQKRSIVSFTHASSLYGKCIASTKDASIGE